MSVPEVSKIIAFSLLYLLFQTTAYSADYQCDISGDNKLGIEEAVEFLREFSGLSTDGPLTVLDCGTPAYDIPGSGQMGTDAKKYILCRMNEIRSQVALGAVVDDGTDGFYPVATNMTRMRWDADLATVAQNYASQCNYGHNSNRGPEYGALTSINNPAVGENIAAYGTSRTIGSPEAVAAIEMAFTGWNGENDQWHYDTINSNSWAAGIGHFTQNVWADTIKVGCGQAWCPDGFPPDGAYNMVFTVCNFYTAGNMWGNYPYQSGNEVCSEDIQPDSTCENGLIATADYLTGLIYECDVDGDGELGLGELINALRVLTQVNP